MVSKVGEKWTKEPIYKYITTSYYDSTVGLQPYVVCLVMTFFAGRITHEF